MPGLVYGPFLSKALNKEIDVDSDVIKAMLVTSAYTYSAAHAYKSSITNELSTVSTTLSAAASAGATTISTAASIPAGNTILIGGEVRTVTNVSGAGPYTLTVAALSAAHASGETVQANPGYTAGGVTVALAQAYVAANSWTVSRANSTAYVVGQVVRPATGNGFVYQALTAGTSGGTVPTYPTTIGGTVVDGGVTWLCVGTGVVQVTMSGTASWASSTITARGIVFYDGSPSTDATRPVIAFVDLGADVSSTNAAWTYTPDAAGIVNIPV